MIVVVKIGTSSVTTDEGSVDRVAIERLSREVAELTRHGHRAVIVTSGAVTAGVATLRPGSGRPTDAITLQALSAIGQSRLMRVYDETLADEGLIAGQVLLAPHDFVERRQYLHARATLFKLLELGVVPIVNENDAVADDEIRFGDNDRIAALVANLLRADLMVLLTDTHGIYDADPHIFDEASLVEEVTEIDERLELAVGGPGSIGGSGGMASKLAASRIASWSGVRVVIAKADRPSVLIDAVAGVAGVGTVIAPQSRRLPARKLWIAFALPGRGRIQVDDGARRALVEHDASLLPAGVIGSSGRWSAGEALEVEGPDGKVFAKGIAQLSSDQLAAWTPGEVATEDQRLRSELIHRDDLVLLLGAIAHFES